VYVVCTEACSCISRRTCAANSSAHPCVAHGAMPMSCRWKAVVLPYPLRRYTQIRRCRQVRVRCAVSGKRILPSPGPRSNMTSTTLVSISHLTSPNISLFHWSSHRRPLCISLLSDTSCHFGSLNLKSRGGRASPSHRKDCTQWHGTRYEPTSPLPSSRDTSVGSYV
jgi:hypothetical protein